MWSKTSIAIAFPKDPALTTGKFPVGDLMGLDAQSEIVDGAGVVVFPLKEVMDVTGGETRGSLALTGIALVKIQVVTGITTGLKLSLSTNRGAKLAVAGEKTIGIALATPTYVGELIPVLLNVDNTPA